MEASVSRDVTSVRTLRCPSRRDRGPPSDTPTSARLLYGRPWKSDEDALLRCCVCAGLYPNVGQVQKRSAGKGGVQAVVASLQEEKCKPHPSSLLSRSLTEIRANHAFVLYHSKVLTSQVFLHESTVVGVVPLLLFGGPWSIHRKGRVMLRMGDLRVQPKSEQLAVLLKLLRAQLDRLLVLALGEALEPEERDATLTALARLLALEDVSGAK